MIESPTFTDPYVLREARDVIRRCGRIIKRNRSLIDDVITIKTSDAIDATKKLAHKGYFVGISSGANYLAALRLKQKYNNVITLFPDRGDRYLTLLYKNK